MERLQKWSLVAEIVAAASVVFTLAILILEVRDNTSAVRAQTYQELTGYLNEYRMLFADPVFGPEWTRVQAKRAEEGLTGLTRAELLTLHAPSTVRWGIYESAYYANERGVLGEQEWERYAQATCRAYEEDADFWEGQVSGMELRDLQTSDFAAFVESTCQ